MEENELVKAGEVTSLMIKMQRSKSLEKMVQREVQWQTDGTWRVRTKYHWKCGDV